MDNLTVPEQAIMGFLQADAAQSGTIHHFDPGWLAWQIDLYQLELCTAARQLASRGMISVHEHRGNLTDIAMVAVPAKSM